MKKEEKKIAQAEKEEGLKEDEAKDLGKVV